MSMPDSPVWFITGCSTGFGRELARLIIEQGGKVVATARSSERVADLVEGAEDPGELERGHLARERVRRERAAEVVNACGQRDP